MNTFCNLFAVLDSYNVWNLDLLAHANSNVSVASFNILIIFKNSAVTENKHGQGIKFWINILNKLLNVEAMYLWSLKLPFRKKMEIKNETLRTTEQLTLAWDDISVKAKPPPELTQPLKKRQYEQQLLQGGK